MIRGWQEKDSIELRKMIKAYLQFEEEAGSLILASEENVTRFLQRGMSGGICLVWEENNELLSYMQVDVVSSPWQMTGPLLEVLGRYTIPKARSRFLSTELLREIAVIGAENGFTKWTFPLQLRERKVLEVMFRNPAIWPVAVGVIWDALADPQFEFLKDQVVFQGLKREVG